MFKSTTKLLLNNFSAVWKILLYKIIIYICIIGLTTVICLPIISELIKQGFFTLLQTHLSNMFFNFNLNALVDNLILILKDFWQIVVNANLVALCLSIGIVSVIVCYFVNGLYHLAVIDDLHFFMSSNLKLGFMNCYISNFGKALKLQSVKLVTSFLLDALILAGTAFIYSALVSVVSALAPIIAIAFMLLLFSAKLTLLSGIETSMVVNNVGIIDAVKRNFKAISRRYISIFSNALIILVLLLFLNMFAVFFTFGTTLLITLPLSSLVVLIFKNVVYYECTGMRYYADNNTIMMPKKLEAQDKFSKVKDII